MVCFLLWNFILEREGVPNEYFDWRRDNPANNMPQGDFEPDDDIVGEERRDELAQLVWDEYLDYLAERGDFDDEQLDQ